MNGSNVFPFAAVPYSLNSAASTNSNLVKAVSGSLFTVIISNEGGTAAFVKFYDKTSAPTVGTDRPLFFINVPAASSVVFETGPLGFLFTNGIGLGITGAAADANVTAVAASQVKVNLSYV